MRQPERERVAALAVGFAVLLVVGAHAAAQYVPSTFLFRDGRFYQNVTETLVSDGTLEQSRFAASWYSGQLGWNYTLDPGWSNVSLGVHGEHWPKHPYVHPVAATLLYFAFGVPGSLVFSVLVFGLIAGGIYLYARAFVGPTAAGLSAATLCVGTGILDGAYNFGSDAPLLACFACALGATVRKRGGLAGFCFALGIVIKPTLLMMVPVFLALVLERRDPRTLARALLGGSSVMLVYALSNTLMFGAPWELAYDRTLVTENGLPALAKHSDAFGTPLEEGLKRVFGTDGGLQVKLTLLAISVFGVPAWLTRRPWSASASLFCCLVSTVVFAKYTYDGDRFHWPAAALLIPPFALLSETAGNALRAVLESSRWIARKLVQRLPRALRRAEPSPPAWAGAGAVMLVVAASLATVLPFPPDADTRVPSDGYLLAARALHEGSPYRSHAVSGDVVSAVTSAGRDGAWVPRTSPVAAAIASIALYGGPKGLLFLHILACALGACCTARWLATRLPEGTAAVCAAAPWMLAQVRDVGLRGGPLVLGVALVFASLALASTGRVRRAALVSVLAAACADSAWLLVPGCVALWCVPRLRVGRVLWASLVALAAWLSVRAIVFGDVFVNAEDRVLLHAGDTSFVVSATRDSLLTGLTLSAEDSAAAANVYVARSLVLIGVAATIGWLVCLGKTARLALPGIALAALALAPGVARDVHGAPSALALVLLAPGLTPLALSAARVFARWGKRPVRLACILVACLLAIGGVRRALEDPAFHAASRREVLRAVVRLGDIPCDFLAWERFSWECSQHDPSPHQMTGLSTDHPPHVNGRVVGMVVLPTGPSGEPRTISWHARTGSRLAVRVAALDDQPARGELVVRVRGVVIGRLPFGEDQPPGIHTSVFATPGLPPRAHLQFEVRGRPERHAAGAVFDAEWR